MRLSWIITHKYHKKDEASPLMKCIRRYVQNEMLINIHFVLVGHKSIHFWWQYEQKTIFTFCSQWPWPLTFGYQICSPAYSCPALYFHRIISFYGFPASIKSEARDGRTDRRTDGVQHLMWALREDCMDNWRNVWAIYSEKNSENFINSVTLM